MIAALKFAHMIAWGKLLHHSANVANELNRLVINNSFLSFRKEEKILTNFTDACQHERLMRRETPRLQFNEKSES